MDAKIVEALREAVEFGQKAKRELTCANNDMVARWKAALDAARWASLCEWKGNHAQLIESLLNRAANARREGTATALADALHFEEAAAALSPGLCGERGASAYAGDVAPHDDREKSAIIVHGAYGWTMDDDGRVYGLVSGDMGYAATHIVIGREDRPDPDAIRREALEDFADELERDAKAIPIGAEDRARGGSVYDWHMTFVRMARAKAALIAPSDKGDAPDAV